MLGFELVPVRTEPHTQMNWLPPMSNAHRNKTHLRALLMGLLPLGCSLLVPGMAQAQAYSPGALVTGAPPSFDGGASSTGAVPSRSVGGGLLSRNANLLA